MLYLNSSHSQKNYAYICWKFLSIRNFNVDVNSRTFMAFKALEIFFLRVLINDYLRAYIYYST